MAIFKNLPRKYLYILAALALVVVGVLVLELTNTTHFFHSDKTVAVTGGQATKGEPSSQKSSESQDSASDSVAQPGDNKSSSGGSTSTATLTDPIGPFVSNHRPSLSQNLTQSSVCSTTSGATCQITFTKGDVVKSLSAQVTDRGGATYWSWKPNDINLTEGTWQVQAVATLGDQTKTAKDALDLEVSP